MPWLATLLAAVMLPCVLGGSRFGVYEELTSPGGAGTGARNYPKRCSRFLGNCAEPPDTLPGEEIDSKMLNALFGLERSTPSPTVRPTESALNPYQLPDMYYNDFYEDLLTNKRNDVHAVGCDCKVMNDLVDLGSMHFPRYLMSAVCESLPALGAKCKRGSNCKPLEYKVKVLTLGVEQMPPKEANSRLWQPEEEVQQSSLWEFKTVNVTAGCFCTH